MPEIAKMLVLSTAHLKLETLDFLNSCPTSDDLPFSGGSIQYGWLMYAHEGEPDLMPDEMWAACEYAHKHGCDYIKYDCDAETVDELPVYEHG